jgi:hypothetical protein
MNPNRSPGQPSRSEPSLLELSSGGLMKHAYENRPGCCRCSTLYLSLAICAVLSACGRSGERPEEGEDAASRRAAMATADSSAENAKAPTRTEMRNVDLRIAQGATLHVTRLVGSAVSVRAGEPVVLDDKHSYVIHVETGDAFIGYQSLSRVLNDYTFDFEGAPVKKLEVKREEDPGEEDEIQLTGHLKKVLGVPFEIEGRPEVTPDGRIRIRTTSIQALDIKMGGLMHALGLEPKDMLGHLEERGLEVDGNDLILDAGRALPPPRVEGRLTSVRVDPNGLQLSFGSPGMKAGKDRAEADRTDAGSRAGAADSSNYLWFRKGTIRIGKMTQRDADLRIVDADPKDALDFYGDRMTEQLVAGYAKLNATGGLTIFVPDYGDIR